MDSVCYLITGKLTRNLTILLLHTFRDVPHKVISTWHTEDRALLEALHANGFHVVLNFHPVVKTSCNYQSVCITNGCHKVLGLGFTTCIRIRSDMAIDNLPGLTQTLLPLLTSKLLCLSGMSNAPHPQAPPSSEPTFWYFLDALIAGSTHQLLQFFSPRQEASDTRCAEKFWIETALGRPMETKEDVQSLFDFCGLSLVQSELNCLWIDKGWEVFHSYINPTNYFIWYA